MVVEQVCCLTLWNKKTQEREDFCFVDYDLCTQSHGLEYNNLPLAVAALLLAYFVVGRMMRSKYRKASYSAGCCRYGSWRVLPMAGCLIYR